MDDRIELIFKIEFMRIAVASFMSIAEAERLWQALKKKAQETK